jgi:hypothetical protein
MALDVSSDHESRWRDDACRFWAACKGRLGKVKAPLKSNRFMMKIYQHCPPIFLFIVVFVVVTIPFLSKAYHIDDPLFLWSAKQILSDPINFYGFNVNWYGYEMPAYLVNKNPPLASYYFAAVAYLFGWHEFAFHCSVLVLSIAVIFGTYRLARYFCSSPMLATSISAFTPLFLVSSTTVMCDVMMVSLWTWALVLWIGGISGDKQSALYLASFMAVLCTLTKYTGIFLFPLFFIFALAHKRKLGAWLLPLFMGAPLLWMYEEATRNLYGIGLLSDAVLYSSKIKNLRTTGDIQNLTIGFSFLGGCLINVLVLFPVLWKKRGIIAGLAGAALLMVLLPILGPLGNHPLIDANGIRLNSVIHLSLFVTAGISCLVLGFMDFLNNRDEYGLILFAWIVGIFTFGAFVNWTINARSFLPLAPAAGILLVRGIERLSNASIVMRNDSRGIIQSGNAGASQATITSNNCHYFSPWSGGAPCPDWRMVLLLIPMVLVAVSVTWADYRLANTAREAAVQISNQYAEDGRTVWFQGHWGFQYYMEREGAKALDLRNPNVLAGDIIVIPSNNTNVYAINPMRISLIETIRLTPSSWIATMSPSLGAGFYWDGEGPLPFAIGCVPPEEYYVFKFHDLTGP